MRRVLHERDTNNLTSENNAAYIGERVAVQRLNKAPVVLGVGDAPLLPSGHRLHHLKRALSSIHVNLHQRHQFRGDKLQYLLGTNAEAVTIRGQRQPAAQCRARDDR